MRIVSILVAGTIFFLLGLVLLVPPVSAQKGGTVAILLPGKVGAVPFEFLIRNRGRIGGAGIETRVAASPANAAAIPRSEKQKGRKVVLVGFSLGARGIAKALSAGAPADGVVLVSGVLSMAMSGLGTPSKLPPTLIVHHRSDPCQATRPADVATFQNWAGGRARVVWIDTKARPGPDPAGAKQSLLDDPCGPYRAHGFHMQDSAAVAAIVSFIRSR